MEAYTYMNNCILFLFFLSGRPLKTYDLLNMKLGSI